MSFRDLEKSFFDLHWQLDPVAATQAGVPGHDDRYGRFSPAALAPHLAALKSIAIALEGANAADLEEEIDRTALLNEIRVMLRRFEDLKPQAKNPEFWLSHLLGGLHHLLLAADRTPAEKAAAAIGRLEDIVDHMMLRDPSDHRNVLRQLTRDLQTTIDLEELLSKYVFGKV